MEENWSKKWGYRQLDGASKLGFAIGRRFLKGKRGTIEKSNRELGL
jgi:hypothetical protein